MALFQTGDGTGSPVISCILRLRGDVWAKRALIEALFLLTQDYNWAIQGSASIEYASELFSEALNTVKFGAYMVGSMVPYVTTNPPFGTIPCDGASYLRTDYPLLYSVIDNAYIIDADTFTTPVMAGQAVIGAGLAASGTTFNVNSNGGSETHTLTVAELASHTHIDTGHTHVDGQAAPTLIAIGAGVPAPSAIPSVGLTGSANANLANTGSDNPHNNMQPYLALNWAIIAL